MLENDNNKTLEYYMITEPLCEEYCDLLRYGVKIRQLTKDINGEIKEEISEIRDIFYRRQDAEEFMETIMIKKVTPTAFHDIVKKYIQDKINPKNNRAI